MNNAQSPLLEIVASFENLLNAFKESSKGKKNRSGYQKFIFNYGEKLKGIELEIKQTGNYKWSGYREFFVHDPKKRLVMAAPFRDRIVHTAIHRVVFPIIDPRLGARTYACRFGMGNRNAVLRLKEQLLVMNKNRYCIKLDVQKYFDSIPHTVLCRNFLKELPDKSLDDLIHDLVGSHDGYALKGKGIPIGNLTSQLFANFYLSSIDKLACEKLGISHSVDHKESEAHYMRYMDDMVILTRDKSLAFEVAMALVKHAKENLELIIPPRKIMVLGSDPIPFLGFVLSEDDKYRPLRRNERKFVKKLKRATLKGKEFSLKAQMIQSYESWQNLDMNMKKV